MKRFIALALVLFALVTGAYLLIFQNGVYLSFLHQGDITLSFRTEDGRFLPADGEDAAPLLLRGVELSSFLPGHHFSDFAASEDDYARYLEQIGALGANLVEVTVLMDDEFYNALYAYNTAHASPLYLLQGVAVEDAVNASPRTAYDSGLLRALVAEGKLCVDALHGQRDVLQSGINGGGRFRQDVSPWVLGYVLTAEFEPDTIAYTDFSVLHDGVYEGRFYRSGADASAFEACLAQVLDEISVYESEKYRELRPVGFTCDPSTDCLIFEPLYARQLGKYAVIDAEHIESASDAAGHFVVYRLSNICPDFSARLAASQREALAPILDTLPTDGLYDGYIPFLSSYHSIPVLANYSSSSARGISVMGEAPSDEFEQGEELCEISALIEENGWAGGIVSTWQDVWTRKSWNTAFAKVSTNSYLWHDLQTDTQGMGLLAYRPGEEPVCVLDGSGEEWTQNDLILQSGELSLYARFDAEGITLYLRGASPDTPIYLPIDVSPDMGTRVCAAPALRFERDAEFLLCLDGREDSVLLVSERCDATRENFLYETEGLDPFVEIPAADSGRFVPVHMALENDLLVESLVYEARIAQRLGSWETGKLVHGSLDPDSPDCNSLADFCFGPEGVEIRLPWLLLNIGDPPNRMAHEDYYKNFGVEFQRFSRVWFGIGTESGGEISMAALALRGWDRVAYREELKQSYYVLQSFWKGGD